MSLNGVMSIAGVILALAIVGVVLFVVVMGTLFGLMWIAKRFERCPHCGRRGGVRTRNHWLETRATPEGVRYLGSAHLQHCERCDWIIVGDSETGTRCIGPDEEEWQEWRDRACARGRD